MGPFNLQVAKLLPKTACRSRLSTLESILKPERAHLLGAAAAITTTSGGTVAFPYFMGNILDGFASSSNNPEMWIELVNSNTAACVGALSLVGFGGFLRAYLLETSSERIARRLRLSLFDSILSERQNFFDHAKTGDLLSRLGSDVTRVSRSIMDGAFGFRVLLNAITGTVMVAKTVPLAIVPQLLAPVVLMFVGGVAYGAVVRGISRRQTDAQAKAMHVAEESLSLVRVVKLFNGENRCMQQYQKALDNVYALAQSNALATGGKVTAFVTIGGGFILHTIYNCGMLISGGTLTLGQTAALAGYLLVCGNAYQGLVTSYGDIQKALGACDRLVTLLPENRDMTEKPFSPILFTGGPPALTLSDVSFGHSLDHLVLSNVSIHVPGGARQAIVGLSGCGKSTILNLMAKIYDPISGRILVNNSLNYDSVDGYELREKLVSFVPQDTALFNASIRENIVFPHMDEELDDRLARMARLDFVKDWEAPVGERGQNLSGGERQRVAIARALVKKKPILLLDEATSALDSESDKSILESLKSVDSTIVAVTHRMSAIEWSDRLTVLAEGRVVQEGDTAQLLKNPGPVLQRLLTQIDRKSV